MNKQIIMAGAASTVIAAGSVVVVPAADVTTVSDTVSITVNESCSLGAEAAGTSPTATFAGAGVEDNLTGSTFKVVCTGANGWTLTAVGAGTEGHTTELWDATSSKGIATCTDIDASHTNRGFKLAGTGIASGYEEFSAIPGTATTVVEGAAGGEMDSISVTCGVSFAGSLQNGTCTGKITYVLAEKAGGA